jgi:hypothetical protein
MSLCPCLQVSGIPQTENSNFRKRQKQILFAAKGMENGFSLVGKRSTIMDDCCFSKRVHLWMEKENSRRFFIGTMQNDSSFDFQTFQQNWILLLLLLMNKKNE